MGALATMLKIRFKLLYSDQLTRNFIGSMEVTCKSEVAEIILIGNLRWLPS